jgi:hypothetical protein
MRQEDADESHRDGEMDSHFHLAAPLESDTRIHSGYIEVQYAFRGEICVAQMTEEAWLLRQENPSKLFCH